MTLKTKHGHFTDDGHEFVITHRDLPVPWHNLLCTESLNAVISHLGAGLTYGRCQINDRVTAEESPRLVFVRDNQTGRHWTINGVGPNRPPDDWECRHGFGYTTIRSTTAGIAGEVTYFLAPQKPVEIWRICLTNTTRRPRDLSLFSYVKWSLAYIGTPGQNDNVYTKDGTIFAECWFWAGAAHRSSLPQFNREWDRIAFMASSRRPVRFDCLPEEFVGQGTDAAPAAVKAGRCLNSFGRGGENIGVLEHPLKLRPGQTARLVVLVGVGKNRRDITRLIRRYADPTAAGAVLKQRKVWWDEYLARMTIELPDRDITTFANGWNRYTMHWRYFTRFGLRDTAQDMVSYFPFDLVRARRRMALVYQCQIKGGNAYHEIEHFRFPNHVTVNSDKPLWLPWMTAEYLKETGDWDWLERKFAYHDGGQGTVYEHLVRAIDWVLSQSGRYGLPLVKIGDWNDALSGSWRRGVSVWMAIFLYQNLREMHEIARRTSRQADAARFAAEAERLKKTVNDKCWDGAWYVRVFDDDGRPIGSRKNKEGRIYIEPQTWAVMSGLAPAERARTCLESVERLMDTPVGLPMLAPPYRRPAKQVGELSRLSPGYHHNGGVWNHVNTWAMLAECLIERTDRALDLYKRIFPPRLAREVERFASPPYAFGSYTNPPVSRFYGQADTGCNTGTTCWAWRVLFEGFCGIHAEYDGLRIAPRLPMTWKWAQAKRPFRKALYSISIENPEGVASGIRSIELDGMPLASNLLPGDGPAGEHTVRVVMGRT